MKSLTSLLFVLIDIASCSAQMKNADVQEIRNKYLDIPYATLSPSQKLDLYLPDSVEGAMPVILSIHGGAFMFGDKGDGQVNPMLEGLKRGYAVVSLNYRLSGESTFPAQIHDIKAAIRWVKANADRYHLNAGRMAVWGGSAGGHLASLAGTSAGVTELEDLGLGNAQYDSKIQAVVDWFGPVDFLTMDEQFIQSGKGKADHGDANSPESRLMGKKISLVPDEVRKASPETYISADDPAFLIQHGTEDRLVPVQQSEIFYKKLVSTLGEQKVILNLLLGSGHGGPAFESKENLDRVFIFLDKQLKE